MQKKLIKLISLNKNYGQQQVFSNFSYSFSENGLYLLFGESGCGKTTLLNIICGMTSFDSGKVQIAGQHFYKNVEWEKITQDSALMMGCVVVRTEFLEQNPAAVKKFMEEYEASVNAVSDLEKTASLCEKFEIIPAAAVAKKAIPNCHIAFTAGEEMKADLGGYFKVLFEANPKSIGGALPDDNFYYIP